LVNDVKLTLISYNSPFVSVKQRFSTVGVVGSKGVVDGRKEEEKS
jgi:hypothetical protein